MKLIRGVDKPNWPLNSTHVALPHVTSAGICGVGFNFIQHLEADGPTCKRCQNLLEKRKNKNANP